MLITSVLWQVLGVKRIHFHSSLFVSFFLVLISKDNLRGARFVLIFTRIIVRKMLHKLHGHHSTNITDLFT